MFPVHILYIVYYLEKTTRSQENWLVKCENKEEEFEVTCEYLVIATGHHAKPKVVSFPGEDQFRGTVISFLGDAYMFGNNQKIGTIFTCVCVSRGDNSQCKI